MAGIGVAAHSNQQVQALKFQGIQVDIFEPDQGLVFKHCRCSFQVAVLAFSDVPEACAWTCAQANTRTQQEWTWGLNQIGSIPVTEGSTKGVRDFFP